MISYIYFLAILCFLSRSTFNIGSVMWSCDLVKVFISQSNRSNRIFSHCFDFQHQHERFFIFFQPYLPNEFIKISLFEVYIDKVSFRDPLLDVLCFFRPLWLDGIGVVFSLRLGTWLSFTGRTSCWFPWRGCDNHLEYFDHISCLIMYEQRLHLLVVILIAFFIHQFIFIYKLFILYSCWDSAINSSSSSSSL